MKANALRKLYLDFFNSKEHKIVPSAPIVVKNDPSLMFTNAGMNQFKSIFLGDSTPKYLRVANSQKCLRVSGKHNDLEEVGHDTYHHTMFEMLGSWSFGDYFKQNAINLAWEFLVDVCNLDKERLYVTIFEGHEAEKLVQDTESLEYWKNHLPQDRILLGSKKDNFWEMGEVGPCGPCSEIHFDNRPESERKNKSGKLLVNKEHPQVIEIWNLVFMQFNRLSNKKLESLSTFHVDTGMGFERLAMIMQGKQSNYDTDIFQPIINNICKHANISYGNNKKQDIAIRVVADHIRAVVFSIADGQLPSNAKSGYVVRRILRRAIRYAYTFLNLSDPFIFKLVPDLINQMSSHFNSLRSQQDLIQKVVQEEELSFLRTLADGLKRIKQIVKTGPEISGKAVFELYDTYGFPVDLTALILSEHNLTFSQLEFEAALQEQKERSQQAGKIQKGDWIVLIEDDIEEFVGYSILEADVKITKYREVSSKDGVLYHLVLNLTPFYAEGGGQVGDTGFLNSPNEIIEIIDTKKENNLIIHFTKKLPVDMKTTFKAKVNQKRRIATSRNHTATHLLHESLRKILGTHVLQKGSLVHYDYFRFDFSHFSKISDKDLIIIEKDVNLKILDNLILQEHSNLPISQAKELGAIMLFGEKYDDVVRMIQFGTSKELCGGTHVKATGEIGLFKILSESSTSSGIRRIEAVTGEQVLTYINEKVSLLEEISRLVKNRDVKLGVKQLVGSNKELENQLLIFKKNKLVNLKNELIKSSINLNGINFIAKMLEVKAEDMKNLSFQLRSEKNLVLVLAAKMPAKALLSVMLTEDLCKKGFDAVSIIKDISKEINGGGGGQPYYATAGGSNLNGINSALEKAKLIINKKAS